MLLLGVVVVTIALLYVVFREHLTLEAVAAHETQLRQLIDRYPVRGVAVGLLLYTVVSMVPGTTGKSLVFGWFFGFWWALVQVNLGLTAAALLSFLFSRYVLRDAIQSKFGYYLDRINRALHNDGAYVVLSLRLVHAPFTFINYSMGATPIRTKTFWWSSQVGLLPGNVVFVLAGTQLPTLSELTTHGLRSVLSPEIIAAFLLMAVFPFLVRWIIHRIRKPGQNVFSESSV